MTRVSENSQRVALNHLLNKTKSKLEDLQLKGTSLKRVTKPSDDPLANIEAMSLGTVLSESKQYQKNADYALMQLNVTDKTLEELSDVLMKAKEIAIAQSSDFYDVGIRKNVANEIYQLRNMALSIGNKRIGNRYIFSGHKTLTRPFDINGDYFGDKGALQVEVAKDFFVAMNVNGHEVFFSDDEKNANPNDFLNEVENIKLPQPEQEFLESDIDRQPANETDAVNFKKRDNIFSQLSSLIVGLETGDAKVIQNLLERFDSSINRLITLRTKVGSVINSIETSKTRIDSDFVDTSARRSKLVDADVGELFTDLQRQQTVLNTAYKSGQATLNQSLMDFLK
jgi:flagellar hook-associated protein 3 FlgL